MKIAVLGAGIAGLAAAAYLRDHAADLQVFEASGTTGGMARSFDWHGFPCDLGTHRFYTPDRELLDEVRRRVPLDEMPRRTAIFARGKWIGDPINAAEIILKYPFRTSFDVAWNYLFRKKIEPAGSFEALVLNQFGSGLNRFFFKPYSEKVFGIPADRISPAWAQRKLRIGGLRDLLLRRRRHRLNHKVLYYPSTGGYGAIAGAYHREVEPLVRLHTRLVAVAPEGGGYRCTFSRGGETFDEAFDVIVSTLPLSVLAEMLGCRIELAFRDVRLAYLLVDRPRLTRYQWFYLADARHAVNRVCEFKNFVETGLPEDRTVVCCEVTNTEGFTVERAVAELAEAGVLRPGEVLDTKTVHVPRVYPVYDLAYEEKMDRLRAFFAGHENLHLLGRTARFAHQDVDDILDEARQLARRIAEGAPAGATAASL